MLTIVFGKVEEVRFFCAHSTLRGPSEYPFAFTYPQSTGHYLRYGEIEEPSIVPYIKFLPNTGTGRWEEIKRSNDISEHLVPERDFIQINGKDYKILQKGQRLDDGVILYYIDYFVDDYENKESHERAMVNMELINKLNQQLENELRLKLEDPNYAMSKPPSKRSFWQKVKAFLANFE